jgi:hypothetical protein
MSDVHQYWSNDFVLSSSGDLLAASGLEESKQRILRRLMTNRGEYVWHTEYGAGVPQMIGQNLNIEEIQAVIGGQMKLEESVSHDPEPVITVTPIDNGVYCHILYTDANTNQQTILRFEVNR